MKKLIGIAMVLAGFVTGTAALGGATHRVQPATVSTHPTGHESRTAADCAHLPGNIPPAVMPPPAGNMRYWCTQCVNAGNQHFHPDCPAGSRCSPNNGAPQCGGGTF